MKDPDHWELPEWAITSFEQLNSLRITVHDLGGALVPYLRSERFTHCASCCVAVKATHRWACVDFEVSRLRKELSETPQGRWHQCHAGFLEWVVPVFMKDRLEWVLFAGPARISGEFSQLVKDTNRHRFPEMGANQLRAFSEMESMSVLESLRQLRSRLLEWYRDISTGHFSVMGPASGGGVNNVNRRLAIQRFLHFHHTSEASVVELARFLGLSVSRTSHVVRELFDCSYMQLLNRMRLRTSAALLRNSSLSVLDVCLASGFRDVSHFHRQFQKQFQKTPQQYRRIAES